MGKWDELIARVGRAAQHRTLSVSHESSNLDSLMRGFQERPSGISFARLPHERMSSPTPLDEGGRRGIVYATVSGRGVDYMSPEIRRLMDEINAAAIEGSGSTASVIPGLRGGGIDWVNNWNSIGEAPELHVLQPRAVDVRRVFELPLGRSYRFPSPPEVVPARMYADPEFDPAWVSPGILPVRR
jgi:hypothetical protein